MEYNLLPVLLLLFHLMCSLLLLDCDEYLVIYPRYQLGMLEGLNQDGEIVDYMTHDTSWLAKWKEPFGIMRSKSTYYVEREILQNHHKTGDIILDRMFAVKK